MEDSDGEPDAWKANSWAQLYDGRSRKRREENRGEQNAMMGEHFPELK